MKSKEFIRLQNKWYNKLKKSGFEDIEWTNSETGENSNYQYLTKGTPRNKVLDRGNITRSYEYFYRCRRFSFFHKFDKREDKVLWDLYSNGVSYRDIISTTLRDSGNKWNLYTISIRVHQIIKVLEQHIRDYPEVYMGNEGEDTSIEEAIANEPPGGFQGYITKDLTLGYNDET